MTYSTSSNRLAARVIDLGGEQQEIVVNPLSIGAKTNQHCVNRHCTTLCNRQQVQPLSYDWSTRAAAKL